MAAKHYLQCSKITEMTEGCHILAHPNKSTESYNPLRLWKSYEYFTHWPTLDKLTFGAKCLEIFFFFLLFFPPLKKSSFCSFLTLRMCMAHQYWNLVSFANFAKGHTLGSFDQNCWHWEKGIFYSRLSCLQNRICAVKSLSQEFIRNASKSCSQRRISDTS